MMSKEESVNYDMKIAVLASGGVDSSFALHLLKSQGHDVTAHYLKIWNPQYEQEGTSCPWQEDVDSVKAICSKLDIPYVIHNLQIEYEYTVMAYMLEELKAGRTPNPDVYCNYYIKFGAFFDNISFKEYDYVASGHYATKKAITDDCIYWHSADPLKDQSFFLSKLTFSQIKKIIFPCSNFSKKQIREYAILHDLPQKDKKDSQGLCFIGKINYGEFISKYIPNKPGLIINDDDGSVLGQHEGLHLYTMGQRHSIHIGNGPWYVCGKDINTNILYVINKLKLHTTMTNVVALTKLQLHIEHPVRYIKYKHPQTELLAGMIVQPEDRTKFGFKLDKEQSYLSFSSGQVVAMYDSEYCLVGSAKIE